MSARLAVYLVLAAEDDGREGRDAEMLDLAEAVAGRLSESEFQLYAEEYDDSRLSWVFAREVAALAN